MPASGDRFEMPDGSVYAVLKTSAETGGEFVEMEFALPPDCIPPPPHVHSHGVEEYEVIEGSFDVTVEGSWSTLGPGESVSVPLGALHTFRNSTKSVVRVRNRHKPAMRFDEFIERMHTTLAEVGITRKRDPRVPLYLSTVMLEFPDTLVPGRKRDLIPMKALAWLGRRLLARKRG